MGSCLNRLFGHSERAGFSLIYERSDGSNMSFGFFHRLRLLNGLIARHAVLNGDPMAGQGAYGVIGAILVERTCG